MSIGTPSQQFGHTFLVSTLLGDIIVSSTESTTCTGNQTYDISASTSVKIVKKDVNLTVPSYN